MASRQLSETAYAKLNLALHVRRRRADGYHDIETLFAFADAGDLVTAEACDDLELRIIGRFGSQLSDVNDNLVFRAAEKLRHAAGCGAGARLILDKRLPVASGIGGGSADAAAALRLLVRLWRLTPQPDDLRAIAAGLGADVPACLDSATALGAGLGDRLTPVDLPGLARSPVLLVNPGIPCPTGPVFAGWAGADRGALDPARWQDAGNDLEASARALVPEIGDVLTALGQSKGAKLARMSGSGATCFALFDRIDDCLGAEAELAAAHPGWWVSPARLR